jgi:hypothetical protein
VPQYLDWNANPNMQATSSKHVSGDSTAHDHCRQHLKADITAYIIKRTSLELSKPWFIKASTYVGDNQMGLLYLN